MIVGLTGGIGVGKTVVADVFKMLGASVFNSDECAKQAYLNLTVKENVITLLGKQAYVDNNTINKKYISDKIFSDTFLLQQLNNIIHPFVGDAFKVFVSNNKSKLIIKESALLFETGIYKSLDKIILVTAPLDLRIKRIKKRDGLSEEAILLKIKNQLSDAEKIKLANFVIKNNETDFIIPQCINLFNTLSNV